MSDQTPSKDSESFGGADKLEGLSARQRKEVREQSRPNAALIHETIRAEGMEEMERTAWALALSGLAAGLSMGFSLIVQGTLRTHLPEGAARELLSPLGYTVGFLLVVLGRQQLFTENTLTPVLPLLHDRKLATLGKLLRLWVIVLAGNTLGTLVISWVLAKGGLVDAAVWQSFLAIGRETLQPEFPSMLLKAVFAGWLIALLVWLLPSAEGAKPFIIVVLAYVVAVSHFSHIIAGSVDAAFAVWAGSASWSEFWLRFFLPTLFGNMLGGVALVAVLNYGQVAPQIEGSE
jgi:formate/nitrite transporter FocA (FNT family)